MRTRSYRHEFILVCMHHRVKRLNRYFLFLLLGFHLPLRENGADNNVSIGFQSLRTFLVNF